MGVSEALNPGNEVNTLQSFEDVTIGRSIVLLYAVAANNAGSYLLTKDGGYSRPIETSFTTGGEVNFDMSILKHTIISGLVAMDIKHGTGAGASSASVTFRLLRVNADLSETSLGTVTSESLGASTSVSQKLVFTATRTVLKVGNKLRLEAVWSNSGGGTSTLSHDPNVAGNELKIYIPVVNLE